MFTFLWSKIVAIKLELKIDLAVRLMQHRSNFTENHVLMK